MARLPKPHFCLSLILTIVFTTSVVSAQQFVSPMGGVEYQDWTIVNYVDLDPSSNVLDWNGGAYSYNGHNAIDFTLPNFAAMDAGVDVYAAQSGTVTAVHDGEFDRWSRINPNPGDLPNYVVIDHGNGVIAEYLHLKKFSILVGVGQAVTAGQKIAEVGSSGNSSDPHLHFAVFESGLLVETYEAPSIWWQTPLDYAGDVFGALDHGITADPPTLEELVNRPEQQDVFLRTDGAGQTVYSWVNLFGFHSGDQLDYYFYRPNGSEYAHWNWVTGDIRFSWWTAGIGLPNIPDVGVWTMEAQRNGVTFFTDTFEVKIPVTALASKFLDGVIVGGQLTDATASDDVYLELDPSPTKNPFKQSIEVVLLAETNVAMPTSFNFVLEAAMTGGPSGDVIQTIYLWNDEDSIWDLIDTHAATETDDVTNASASGDLTDYIHPLTGEIIAKVVWKSPTFIGSTFNWSIDVDKAVWVID